MLRFRLTVAKGLFLAVGVLSAAIGAYGTNLIQEADATKDWPTVQGKIITSEVRPGETEASCRPLVRFEYAIHGTIFHSEQYRLGAGEAMKKAAADELVKKYPVGAPVRVHYDPLNPFMSVLEQGDPTFGYLICAAAVVLLGAVAMVTIGQGRKGNGKAKAKGKAKGK